MNRIEQNMLESMSDTIDKLKDELTMTRQDYEALLEEENKKLLKQISQMEVYK